MEVLYVKKVLPRDLRIFHIPLENFSYQRPSAQCKVYIADKKTCFVHIPGAFKRGASMRKRRKPILLPLSRQFKAIMFILAVCSAAIAAYSCYDYANLQIAAIDESLRSYASRLARSASESYESFENICYSAAYSSAVQTYLRTPSGSQDYEAYQEVETQLNAAALLSANIVDAAVYGETGKFASLFGSAENYRPFAESLPQTQLSFRSAGVAVVNGVQCHILAMPVYSLRAGESRYLGMFFLAVDAGSMLSNRLEGEFTVYEPQIVLLGSDGSLIYGEARLYGELAARDSASEMFYLNDSENPGVLYAVTSYAIPAVESTLFVFVNQTEITRQVMLVSARFLLGMAAMILFLLLLLSLLYRPLIRSLRELTDFMHLVSQGDRTVLKQGVEIRQGLIGSTEIRDVCATLNEMLRKTEELNHKIFDSYTRMYELEANNRKTEIAFLRSQINPHFLYNTLTMICGLAAEGMDDRIISVTGALSQIFRYSIKGSDVVTLREEMEIVKSYLMIQKERFGDRFTVRYELQDDTLDCLIPKMIIQPLVENAIVHGLEKSLNPGELLIGAGRDPVRGYLAIWIFDTGVGMPKDKLEQIRRAVTQSTQTKTGDAQADLDSLDREHHDSIGILNVNSRIVLYYGPSYTLIVDSDEGVGTNIQIRVPYRPKGKTREPQKEESP